MNVEISGRHVQITADIESYARDKVGRVAKYLRPNARVAVVLDREHDKHLAEMIVSGHRGPVIVSHVQHDDLRAAIDLAIDKLDQQLRKHKGRRKDHQGPSMAGESVATPGSGPGGTGGTGGTGGMSGTGGTGGEDEVGFDDIIDEELNK